MKKDVTLQCDNNLVGNAFKDRLFLCLIYTSPYRKTGDAVSFTVYLGCLPTKGLSQNGTASSVFLVFAILFSNHLKCDKR